MTKKGEDFSGIYCIENIENGMKYIGWAKNIRKRFTRHRTSLNNNKHENRYLQNVWNKYGEKIFNFWVIEKYPLNEELLKLMEIYFIAYYNSFSKDGGGYNLTRGGEGTLGLSPSKESREKSRNSQLGEKAHNYGTHPSDETRKLLIGNHWDNKGKNHPFYGTHRSEETKKLISEGQPSHKDYSNFKGFSEEYLKFKSENMLGENNPRWAKKRKDATSPYFGVCKEPKTVRWQFRILIDGKTKVIASFKTELEAAHAYNDYLIEHNIKNRPFNIIPNEQ